MEAMKVGPILLAVMIVVGMLVATKMTPITAEIRVVLRYGKLCRLYG
jgi:hypothetical protein